MNEQIVDLFEECPSYEKIVKNKSLYDLICEYVPKLHLFHLEEINKEILTALSLIKGIATDEKQQSSSLEKDFLEAYDCLKNLLEREMDIMKEMTKPVFKCMLSDGYIRIFKPPSSNEKHYYFKC